ncbi:hypothetical protein Hanom_Chr02g00124281 [Helianthus anomalus]
MIALDLALWVLVLQAVGHLAMELNMLFAFWRCNPNLTTWKGKSRVKLRLS